MPLQILNAPGAVGNLYAHLFENPTTGLSRGLYWSATLPCASVHWDGEDWSCEVACEWLRWPIKSWKQLDGLCAENTINPNDVECSVYLSEHHHVSLEEMNLSRIPGTTRFAVDLKGTFDLQGYDALDGIGIPVHLHGQVEFDHIVVVPGKLIPENANPEEILNLLSPFIEVSEFEYPIWDRFRYILKPIGNSDA